MIKMIVSDLDGTLFDGAHRLNDRSAAAVKQAQEAGIIFMVATGRARGNVLAYFEEHGIHCPKILLNGAMFLDEHDEIKHRVTMQHEDVRTILQMMEDHQMVGHAYCDAGIACTDPEKMVEEFKIRLKTREHLSDEDVEYMVKKSGFCDYDVRIQDVDEFLKQHTRIYKVEAFANDEKQIQRVRKQLRSMPHLDVSNSVGDNIEVTDGKAQKGLMLENVCKDYGIAKTEVITLGDSMNDLSMIRDFPNSYAMANACPQIQAAAAHQACSNLDDGVAKVIHEVLKQRNR